MIIANTGYPWPVLAVWNEAMGKWATTELEWNLYEGQGDPGFVTELEAELKGWMALPEVERG